MAASRPFLTARWQNLALLNYPVDDGLLTPLLPPGCELDRHEGRAMASLVAFDFLDTRVLGVRWPGFVDFPEINLRFYVRHGDRRGVCFVREFVPQWFVARVARTFYNEPYLAAPMSSRIVEDDHAIRVEHRLEMGGRSHRVAITGGKPVHRPGPESVEHFFKEHQWGFGTTRGGKLLIYEVRHPHWDVYAEAHAELDWDFGLVYGSQWAFLNGCRPSSVVLAAGSKVEVYPWSRTAFRKANRIAEVADEHP